MAITGAVTDPARHAVLERLNQQDRENPGLATVPSLTRDGIGARVAPLMGRPA
jgi:hypothetical protein